jgi:hypothetical protein
MIHAIIKLIANNCLLGKGDFAMNKNLQFYLSLTLAVLALGGITLGFVGCTGLNRQIPSYAEATDVRLQASDKETYLSSGIIDRSFLLFKYDVKISWSEDESSAVRDRLDKLLPKEKWRLVSDWNGQTPINMSEWKKDDLEMFVILTENINDPVISDLERRYGFSDLKPGVTLITMFVFDKGSPLPDKTATIQARNAIVEATPAP